MSYILPAFSALVAAGLGPFLFKIIRIRYGGSAAIIGLAVGLILIPGAGGGITLGNVPYPSTTTA